jgi:hypothetical protein
VHEEPSRERFAILQFGMQHAQCQDVDLWPNISSPAEEDDVEMTGDGEGSGEPSRDEDDVEKQIRLTLNHVSKKEYHREEGILKGVGVTVRTDEVEVDETH